MIVLLFSDSTHKSKGSETINLASIRDKDQAGNDFSYDVIQGRVGGEADGACPSSDL